MTTDHTDLCKRLREDAARWSDEMVMSSLEREAADAIADLREQVATQSNAADMIAKERDAWEKRAKTEATLRLQCANDSQMHLDRALAAEAENAALRAERDALKMEKKARSMIDPVTRLHNLCDGLAESRGESPYDQASWELADADNKELRARAEAAEADNAALRAQIARAIRLYPQFAECFADALLAGKEA